MILRMPIVQKLGMRSPWQRKRIILPGQAVHGSVDPKELPLQFSGSENTGYEVAAFQQILGVDIPETVLCEAASGRAAFAGGPHGEIPFPQVLILREAGRFLSGVRGREADRKAGQLPARWVPVDTGFKSRAVVGRRSRQRAARIGSTQEVTVRAAPSSPTIKAATKDRQIKCTHFSIHKHMHHDEVADAAPGDWAADRDLRLGAADTCISWQPQPGSMSLWLPHAGLSTSWSGSLIETTVRVRGSGPVPRLKQALREFGGEKQRSGQPLFPPSAYGAHSGARHNYKQIGCIVASSGRRSAQTFASALPAGNGLPCAHDPALRQAGLYDLSHCFRAVIIPMPAQARHVPRTAEQASESHRLGCS